MWVGHVFLQPNVGGGSPKFCALEGGGSCFFEKPGFHFLRPPPVLFDQPLKLFECYAAISSKQNMA